MTWILLIIGYIIMMMWAISICRPDIERFRENREFNQYLEDIFRNRTSCKHEFTYKKTGIFPSHEGKETIYYCKLCGKII